MTSKAAAELAWRRWAKQPAWSSKPLRIVTCDVCGKVFQAWRSAARRCSGRFRAKANYHRRKGALAFQEDTIINTLQGK